MDIQDPQTIGVMVFGGFMVISAIGIFLVSTFSMKETSYEEALAKQRKQFERAHLQRSEKKKKDKLTEKKGKTKKKEEKLNGKIPEREAAFDVPEFVGEEEEEPNVFAEPAVPERPFVVAPPPTVEKPVSLPKERFLPTTEKTVLSLKDKLLPTSEKTVPSPKDRLSNASEKMVPTSKDKTSAPEKLVPAPKDKTLPVVDKNVPSPKDKRKKEKKVAKVEPAPSPVVTVASQAAVTKSAPVVELLAKEVPVIAVPPVGVQQSAAVPPSAPIKKVETMMPVEESKLDVLAKKKTAPKKKNEPIPVDSTDGPLYLPYKTLLLTVNSMNFSEGEAQQLTEILMDKANIVQDTWHMATQKGDPVAALKRQLEEKERQLSAEQEDAVAARTKLREVTKELVAEKAKVLTVEANVKEQLLARDKELDAVQARMQASYEDHVNETQQLQIKIQTLKDQLENGPNAQIARLQQENSILRDALNQATSQMESRQNAEMAKLRQDCSRLTKELNERLEMQQQDDEQKRILEEKVVAYEKQVSQLQTLQHETEETLQRRLDEVSEELRKSQSNYTDLLSGMEKVKAEQQDVTDLQIKLASFEAEVKSKAEELDKVNTKFSEVYSEKAQLEERLKSIETLMESCRSKESEDSNLNAAKEAEIEQLQSSLQEKDSLVSSLEKQVLQLRETAEQQKLKNNDLREKNWNAVEALTATEATCREKICAAEKAKNEAEQRYNALEKQTREMLQEAFPQIDVASQQMHSEWLQEFAVSSSPNFISLNLESNTSFSGRKNRRKRLNKNKKKNWIKYTNVADVEGFLDDVRLQERAAGGLISEKSDDTLFFVDTGNEQKDLKLNKGKKRPLHIDLLLQSTSQVPPPKDILSHQVPNAKKLRRLALRQEKLEAQGIIPRKKRLLQARLLQKSLGKPPVLANTGPRREFYDIWSKESLLDRDIAGKDSWYLQQTKKQRIKRPEWLQTKPSQLAAVEVIPPGGSYNPTFEAHQALLLKAHEVELKKLKEEEKLNRQLSVPVKEDIATEESTFQELCQGLIEDSEGEEEEENKEKHPRSEVLDTAEGGTVFGVGEKKTEKQRKREKDIREKKRKLQTEKAAKCKKQELFRLRSIKAEIRRREEQLAQRKKKRLEKRAADANKPKRLGRLKYQELDPEVQLSTELSGCMRTLKPEGNILTDRFKSLQKRNLIEPRERAKFKRKYKLKYVEKRAFKEITL